jgi:glycosyltransferase involved in cell wall biosynthesis
MFYLAANNELRNWGNYFKFYADVMAYNFLSADKLINSQLNGNNHKTDLIHAHDWLGILGGMIAQNEIKKPLLFQVHSTETGRSIGAGSNTIKQIEYEGGQAADGVITVSHAMKEELIELGFPENKIHVVWNGVNPKKYAMEKVPKNAIENLRKSYGIKSHETMLFFIGRLVTVKGADKLVQAMPSVISEYPNTKLILLGIGEMEKEIRDQIKSLNLENHVTLRNEFVDEDQRILHYAASDIVVLPSLYEPFGIVCTEAMSMKKPVVVGARGTNGMREQIIPTGPEQSGTHINPFDPQDIAWGIKEILKQKDKGKTYGINGRKRVEQEFSWEVVADRIQKIYSMYTQN